MRGGERVALAIGLASGLVVLALHSVILVPDEVSAYVPHTPIFINGNADFTPANGVTEGVGSASEPYIIEGWEIDATTSDGLCVANTDAHFIIRDVYVHSGRANDHDGILLINVLNGGVVNVSSIGNSAGLHAYLSDNITVEYGNYSNGNWMGFYMDGLNNLTVNHVNVRANDDAGMMLLRTNHAHLVNNSVDGNLDNGIVNFASTNITFTGNIVFGNERHGFRAQESANLTYEFNSIHSNIKDGISLEDTLNVTIVGNTINSDGVVILGETLPHYNSHMITVDNTVNGKQLLYHKDTGGMVLDNVQMGQLIFANCTDVQASNLVIADTDLAIEVAFTDNASIFSNNLSNNRAGLSIDFSSNVTVMGNVASTNSDSGIEGVASFNVTVKGNNVSDLPLWGVGFDSSSNLTIEANHMMNDQFGVLLLWCTNATIRGNNVSLNTDYGIGVSYSTNILVYHNNIISNPVQGYDNSGSENEWDDGYPSGGNYWSDYVGLDQFNGPNQDIPGSDGIGDTPYVIDGDSQDNFPLMVPFGALSPPSAPQKFQTSPGDRQVTLNWNPPASDGGSPVTNYRIYRGNSPGGEVFLTEIGNVLVHVDGGLTNGLTYYYTVSAVNGVGESPKSDEVNATPTTTPGAPTGLQARLTGSASENVTISWFLSSDDGAGQNSVVSYEIYKNLSYDPNGTGYQLAGSVSNGETELTIKFVGEGDPNNYFYRICAVDLNGLTNCTEDQAAKYTRPLVRGLNLVSIPLIQSDEDTEIVLQTVKWDRTWSYHPATGEWKWQVRFKPYSGGLDAVNVSVGLWIDVTEDSNLTVAGIVPTMTTLNLHRGWNLVGYPSFKTDSAVMDVMIETGAGRIEGFDVSVQPYNLKLMSGSDTLQTGYGYWIEVNSDTIWVVWNV